MEYLNQSFQHDLNQQQQPHFPQHSTSMSHHASNQISQGPPSYTESQQQAHTYPRSSPMATMPNTHHKNETKPRLGKEEVEILEREFQKNPKPTTQTKRQFAGDMGVDLARINNWFQNRRAKRKQEKKQEAYEAGQVQDTLGYSETSSPDYFSGSAYFADSDLLPLEDSAPFSLISGPPPPVASYNPQYGDPASASIESLERTMAAAQAASQHDFHNNFVEHNDALSTFGGSLVMQGVSDCDHALFPSPHGLPHFNSTIYDNGPSFDNSLYNPPSQSVVEFLPSPGASHTPVPPRNYPVSSESEAVGPHAVTTFPSQLLPSQLHNGAQSQSPEGSTEEAVSTGFKYEIASTSPSESPPAPSLPFKSPPPPTDLASRRKKVHSKPAALIADTLRGRPEVGPRTVSHAEGFRLSVASPASSPMRRIVSAGGNRAVLSGRVQKSGVESAQRSPINIQGFADASYNYHTVRIPSLTAGSSLNSSLAPPTPMSPKRGNTASSTTSSVEGNLNFVFNAGVPSYFTTEGDQNLASPPETPHAQNTSNSSASGWENGHFSVDKEWSFEVPDEPLYTPAHEGFPMELHMPQPTYLSSISQPVTPAFGQFNPNFMFGHESPLYSLSSQTQSEYSFPEAHLTYPVSATSPPMKQKTFQFSNSTAADFSEK